MERRRRRDSLLYRIRDAWFIILLLLGIGTEALRVDFNVAQAEEDIAGLRGTIGTDQIRRDQRQEVINKILSEQQRINGRVEQKTRSMQEQINRQFNLLLGEIRALRK